MRFQLLCLLPAFIFLPDLSGQDKHPWDFRPSWREDADCGRNCLFLLLRFCGNDASLTEVSEQIGLDPVKGCSFEDLRVASGKLGLPTEVRYLTPQKMRTMPFPFIAHGVLSIKDGTGHFIFITGYDRTKDQFETISVDTERVEMVSAKSLTTGCTGYILRPKVSNNWLDGVLTLSACTLMLIFWRLRLHGWMPSADS